MTSMCKLWEGPTNSVGYGRLGHAYVHRLAYEKAHGAIPKGLVVRHTCDNSLCINPEHLVIGTQAENMQDAATRGRLQGVHTSLTFADIPVIRTSHKTNRELAAQFNVCQQTISNIKHNRTWSHVK